jgi:hypothetical protein
MYPEKVLRHTASLWVSAVRVICRSLSGEFVVFLGNFLQAYFERTFNRTSSESMALC